MTVVPLPLAPFRVIDPGESQLLRIEALFGLGDAVALRLEQPGEVARFGIAASHQVAGDFGAPLIGSPPQLGFEILRVLLHQQPHSGDSRRGRSTRVPQGSLELLDRGLLAAGAERR
jgi:hypothetical protein